jgi:glycosyltransferase involved in cell wall biosynthesis
MEILGIPEERIRVVYEACNGTYNIRHTTYDIDKIKKKYGIRGDYILAVGTREPRKNLQRVLEALNILVSQYPSISLVVAGKFGWGQEISNFQLLGYVPKEDLACLYAGAEVFVYPSLYEGFGLPILEAMSSGCPVVTSNVSSMPEVAGEAAVLVNPKSVKEIAGGIKRAMKERTELIKKGFARVKEFSWEKTARETLGVYQEAFHQ